MTALVLTGVLALCLFLVLMVLSVPIPFAMLFSGAIGITLIRGANVATQILSNDLLNTFSSYTLTVGPMFGLMGFVASYSGIGASLFNAINRMIGHWRGGLSMATQVACT